ncbi:MAG: hypothetical protein EOP06_20670 [Proteobacteria bacterium]|nr:MAG: hypothetical protein EOP06_20670 [Pseudomonadota bacterium]
MQEKKRKPGPVPGPERRQYTILIEEELGDWGKKQDGGLSDMIRRLLKEAKEKSDASTDQDAEQKP